MDKMQQRVEAENKKQSVNDNSRKQKLIENQQFLVDQMRKNPARDASRDPATGKAGANEILSKRKQQLGGMMHDEEARMNRALLREIARVKRGEQPTELFQAQTNNPI